MDKNELSRQIALKVEEAGGKVFYVGGCVRDKLLHIPNKDIDIEVHGITPEKLYSILEEFGKPLSYGKSFGVYSIKGYDIDIAMPRREKATGKGHRDFAINVDPFIGTKEAARRRDFTINALMEDVLTGDIIDPFEGLKDLEDHVLRCVDPVTFIEDPLRVLRAAQFSSRFHFAIDEKTLALCKGIDLSALHKQRVEEELKKALLKSDEPSLFFKVLLQMDQLDLWFREVKELIGVKQDPIYHPEGDVFVHTMQVLDRSTKYRDEVSDPYCFMLLALCHDLGKIVTTKEIDGRIHSYGHETKGLPLIKTFFHRFSDEKVPLKYLMNMTPLHMRLFALAKDRSSIKAFNKVFDAALEPYDLICFSLADKGEKAKKEETDLIYERYETFRDYMERDHVNGQDLIEAGLRPEESFSELLAYAHKLQLAGVGKEEALKQTLAYAKKGKAG